MIGLLLTTVGLLQPIELPDSAYADTEAVTNIVLVPLVPNYREYRFTISVEGNPSNNVEIVLGGDSNKDGVLDMCEYERIIGWDSGCWKDVDVHAGIESFLGNDGTERSWVFRYEEWPIDWTSIKVVRRGVAVQDDSVEIFNKAMGFYIHIR